MTYSKYYGKRKGKSVAKYQIFLKTKKNVRYYTRNYFMHRKKSLIQIEGIWKEKLFSEWLGNDFVNIQSQNDHVSL